MRLLVVVVAGLLVLPGAGCGPVQAEVGTGIPGYDAAAAAAEFDQLTQLAHDLNGLWVGGSSALGAGMALTVQFKTEPGTRHGSVEFKCVVPDGGECPNPFKQLFDTPFLDTTWAGTFRMIELTDTGASVQVQPEAIAPASFTFTDLRIFTSRGLIMLSFDAPSPPTLEATALVFQRLGVFDAGVPGGETDAGT